MSEAGDFSYFYFMDENLSILSSSKEANLLPSFITFLKNGIHFPNAIEAFVEQPERDFPFPAPHMAHIPGNHSQRTHLWIYLPASDSWETRSTFWIFETLKGPPGASYKVWA